MNKRKCTEDEEESNKRTRIVQVQIKSDFLGSIGFLYRKFSTLLLIFFYFFYCFVLLFNNKQK